MLKNFETKEYNYKIRINIYTGGAMAMHQSL